MTTSNNTIVPAQPKAPRGFTVPKFNPALEEEPLYFDGPSRPTGNAELGDVKSAYCEMDGGFSVTIAGVELSLPAAWRVLDALTNVLEGVEGARAEFESGN